MLARRYEFYVLVARTISHSFASLTPEILFLPLKNKIHIFSPPCNILYILVETKACFDVANYAFSSRLKLIELLQYKAIHA